MKRDKEIYDFIQAEKPEITDADRFVEEFVRLSSLLPLPSSLNCDEDIDKAEMIQKVSAFLKKEIKKERHNNIRWAFVTLACSIAVALVLFFALRYDSLSVASVALADEGKAAGQLLSFIAAFPALNTILASLSAVALVIALSFRRPGTL